MLGIPNQRQISVPPTSNGGRDECIYQKMKLQGKGDTWGED